MICNQISNITISNGGYSIGTISTTGTITVPVTSAGTYSITGYGGGGGGSMSGLGISGSTSTSKSYMDNDVVIMRPNGRCIPVGATLELLTSMLMIIQPEEKLMDDNPALRDAYDYHQSRIKEFFDDKGLRESYESYQVLRKLVSQDDDDG